MQKKHFILAVLLWAVGLSGSAQPVCPCDCAYPVLFLHGWISNSDTWLPITSNTYFQSIWGARADVFHAAANATTSENIAGNDGIMGTSDDDIRWVFPNENNVLASGCVYAMNLDVSVATNGNMTAFPLTGGAPGLFDVDNNESAILKQGALVGKAIEAILAANPTKKKVILVGHSMGGLASREYLQRTVNNNATSAPRWWVNPAAADGHKVAKLLTVGTPHRGSNTMGNISNIRSANPNGKGDVVPPYTRQNGQINEQDQDASDNFVVQNSLPDLSSEAVRDLRYSYDNANIFQNDYPGVYLFGGRETDIPTFPYSYWNNDVNCDGLTNNVLQQGINQNGQSVGLSYQWDGTKDNPNMPLPTNLRYTYYVSNTLSGGTLAGGDLVVDDQRQWLFQGGNGSGNTSTTGVAVPHDGTNHRLSDRIYIAGGPMHTSETADVDNVVRGLDEGDYPAFAWDVNIAANYSGMAQIRATVVTEGPNTTDVDWYKFTLPASGKVKITFYKTPGLAGRVDLYTTTPANYALMSVNGNLSATFTANSSATTAINLTTSTSLAAGTYYFRIRHNNVTATKWRTPYKFTVTTGNVRLAGEETSEISDSQPVWLFNVVPNPINSEGKATFQLEETQKVRLTLTNTLGQIVKVLFEDVAEANELKEVSIETQDIPSGIYFLQLSGNNILKTERIVVSK